MNTPCCCEIERTVLRVIAAFSVRVEAVLRTFCWMTILDPFQVPAGIAGAIVFHHNNLREFSIAGAIPVYSQG